MGGIELLEFLCVPARVRVMDLGQLLVSGFDPGDVTVGKELFHLEFEELHALPFPLGQSGTSSFVRFDGIGGNGLVVVPLQKKKGRVTSRCPVIDQTIPLPSRLEDKFLQIVRRLLPVCPATEESGDLPRPDRKNIKDHEVSVKGKSGIPRVKRLEQSLGEGKDPIHLLSAFLGAVPSSCAEAGCSTGKAFPFGVEICFGENERIFSHRIGVPVAVAEI
jgi:hypothetical protein